MPFPHLRIMVMDIFDEISAGEKVNTTHIDGKRLIDYLLFWEVTECGKFIKMIKHSGFVDNCPKMGISWIAWSL